MIDRVRYYDGEFLRAFDFNDEQTYHVEMRRRLNRYLHVHGIARGLELQFQDDGGVGQVSIFPGLAIDAFGREIYVFAPYTLGNDDIAANRLTKDTYDVWLRYNRVPGTPPSAGYGVCNLANQYTRWTESFKVILLMSPSHPFKAPQFADEDMDDPAQDGVGVLLGSVSVDPTSATAQFSNPILHHRHFWGSITSRIEGPPGYDATAAFDLTKKQTARNPPVSLDIEPNVFAKQNLIVGPDFGLETVVGTKVPKVKTPGTAKIAADLFVQGNIYSSIPDKSNVPQWLGLTDYVRQLIQQTSPEVRVETSLNIKVTSGSLSGGYYSATAPISTTSSFNKVASAQSFAFVSQWEFDKQSAMNALGLGAQVQLSASAVPPVQISGNVCTTNVLWKAGPQTTGSAAIDNLTITAVFICYPG